LNQFIVFGERHLRRLIKEFVEHYHSERFHTRALVASLSGGRLVRRMTTASLAGLFVAHVLVAC
jgi:hypothetical protein